MNADGSGIRPLPVPVEIGRPSSPVWSIDGTHVYVGGRNLAAINASTGEARVITSHAEGHWGDLDLSPDGKWLVYGQYERSCWVSSTDGRVRHKLMEGGVDHCRFASADGRTVVCNDDGDTKIGTSRLSEPSRDLRVEPLLSFIGYLLENTFDLRIDAIEQCLPPSIQL